MVRFYFLWAFCFIILQQLHIAMTGVGNAQGSTHNLVQHSCTRVGVSFPCVNKKYALTPISFINSQLTYLPRALPVYESTHCSGVIWKDTDRNTGARHEALTRVHAPQCRWGASCTAPRAPPAPCRQPSSLLPSSESRAEPRPRRTALGASLPLAAARLRRPQPLPRLRHRRVGSSPWRPAAAIDRRRPAARPGPGPPG